MEFKPLRAPCLMTEPFVLYSVRKVTEPFVFLFNFRGLIGGVRCLGWASLQMLKSQSKVEMGLAEARTKP